MIRSHRLHPLAWLSLCLSFAAQGDSGNDFSPWVSNEGVISFPEGFGDRMAHLGSWFVPEGDASGFHDVYTDADAIAAYRRSGQFPDGTVIVKELRSSQSGDYTTGRGIHYPGNQIKQWFVMIRDRESRFEGNPIWGDGWGWALFKPGSKHSNSANNYRTDCLGCHVPARDTDWIYVEAYPVLQDQ